MFINRINFIVNILNVNLIIIFSGSADCERSHLVSQAFLDANEEDNGPSYNFKDLCKFRINFQLIKLQLSALYL